MLIHEWHTALNQAYCAPVSFGMAQAYYASACAVYRMDRMDRVCVGSDRHAALANWIRNHKRLFMRYDRIRRLPARRRARDLHNIIAAATIELMSVE